MPNNWGKLLSECGRQDSNLHELPGFPVKSPWGYCSAVSKTAAYAVFRHARVEVSGSCADQSLDTLHELFIGCAALQTLFKHLYQDIKVFGLRFCDNDILLLTIRRGVLATAATAAKILIRFLSGWRCSTRSMNRLD